ncbi:MAG: outer membrane beta-barrel protein [Verrucomicrobia bacterium]|nr:outer membrane beta-barrel protein [Verrucomicrobiota bacterium]
MRMNHWTIGLAAAGCVSLPGSARAEESGNQLWTAVSSTTLSGYVNTSMHWNPGTGNGHVPDYFYNTSQKQDGFNLNVVDLTLERELDDATWSAGYKVQLWFGPDARTFGSTLDAGGIDSSAAAVRQAHVTLRAPVGNGLDFKVGVFDGLLGYESHDAGRNPNYTRSYGTTLAPQSHTGIQVSYQFASWLSAAAVVADTIGPVINSKANPPKAESFKAYSGLVALSAPEDWGFLAGSALYGGVVNGYSTRSDWDQTTWYAGATLNTPLPSLRLGASYSYLGTSDFNAGNDDYANALALYSSFQLTDKLSLHGRAEYAWSSTGLFDGSADIDDGNSEVFALTGTLQYDLWRNVISRLEVRWDHQAGDGEMPGYGGEPSGVGGGGAGGGPSGGRLRNSFLVAANVIYQF